MAGETRLRSTAALESAVNELRTAGLDGEALAAPGDPEREVVSLVQTRSADLLVMGAYGHSWWRNLFKGSRTADLLRAARVPTQLLR